MRGIDLLRNNTNGSPSPVGLSYTFPINEAYEGNRHRNALLTNPTPRPDFSLIFYIRTFTARISHPNGIIKSHCVQRGKLLQREMNSRISAPSADSSRTQNERDSEIGVPLQRDKEYRCHLHSFRYPDTHSVSFPFRAQTSFLFCNRRLIIFTFCSFCGTIRKMKARAEHDLLQRARTLIL